MKGYNNICITKIVNNVIPMQDVMRKKKVTVSVVAILPKK
jgi:hypothetical protein